MIPVVFVQCSVCGSHCGPFVVMRLYTMGGQEAFCVVCHVHRDDEHVKARGWHPFLELRVLG